VEEFKLNKVGNECGLYIHIPFCKQACTYCNFHFSTSSKYRDRMVDALIREMQMRVAHWPYDRLNTIYMGGGTPSILTRDQLSRLFNAIRQLFRIKDGAEVTLEANPDDLTRDKLKFLRNETPINRLSIGIQSFDNEQLLFMNRSHDGDQALRSIELARKESFELLTIDLIYGVPGSSNDRWLSDLKRVIQLEIPHLSAYQLTVEPNTALAHGIQTGKYVPVDNELGRNHFDILMQWADQHNWMHYEISNLAQDDSSIAIHNTSYWLGIPYLGIGPSAHSFNDSIRMWNVSNNAAYMKSVESGVWPGEWERLSAIEQYNEWIMTRLRTQWGIDLDSLHAFPSVCYDEFSVQIPDMLERGLAVKRGSNLVLTRDGRHMADRIASELMVVL
jgi:oxygen-independent coproporphyrinogen-3 oxidase